MSTSPAPHAPASAATGPDAGTAADTATGPAVETAAGTAAAPASATASPSPVSVPAPAGTAVLKNPLFPDGPAADPAGSHGERRVRSFHPRRGRLTVTQADAVERLWRRWGVEVDGSPLDPAALMPGLPVVLEIGFGMGEATAAMAAADPSTGILAVDVHTPGQGNLLHLAEREGLTNVRVANGDAVVLLRDMLPPASLAGLRVYFSDPWPKKRHHKRRLIQPDFVALAVSRLRSGAVVHLATDWEPYAEQMLEVLSAEPELENLHDGYAPRPDFRPLTKFERQGLAKGHVVNDLLFRRR
ncbi:tRNA (guanosine(46)-N7)-methyltransferase TrmB [Streptomyces sp. NPDC059637]|uniref:tRNA (guanosine(46)-N7)-methyltransferase TrmB n=1 Tax=Streptomyces sp. NPDC059637 TaxID=3347752 RepID=UPI003684030B